jgi:protein SCO1/2
MKLEKTDIIKIALLLLVFAGGITGAYYILKPEPELPVYNPSDLNPKLVDESLQNQGRHHRVLPFELYNQYGDTITEEDLAGQIYVADFFFTTCPTICIDMARQKRRLQKALQDDPHFTLVSHTVTPEIDSIPIMRDYAQRQGAIKGKWQLLTGPKKEIYRLARKSYFAVVDSGGTGGPEDFIHTENFVLVDPKNRIRGYYDGTSREEVTRLLEDYRLLRADFFPEDA